MRIQESALGNFPVLTLEDPESGAFVSVLPTRGGSVHRLGLPGPDGKIHELMYPMRSGAEAARHRWSKGALLAPWPNRIQDARYEFEGRTYEPVRNFKYQGGHAIHGLIQLETLKLSGKSLSEGWMELSIRSKGWQGYPFPVVIAFRYFLDARSGFRMEFRIENAGKTAAPAGLGWHPYFKLSNSVKPCLLSLPQGKKLGMTDRAVPDGKRSRWGRFETPEAIGEDFVDACLELPAKKAIAVSRLTEPRKDLSIEVWQETGPGKFNYVQVFTHPKRHCLAIEPMTAAPDAFNNGMGLVVLQPGETLQAECGVRLV